MSKFQMLFFGILIVAIVGSVALFSTASRSGNTQAVTVRVWGTVDSSTFSSYVSDLKNETQSDISILYTAKNKDTFETDLVEAIASGRGPDIIFLPQDLIVRVEDKIVPIPFKSFSERTFKDTFIQEGELFLTKNGALALPFTIDPLITFWNRDMFSSAGVAKPPTTWDEIYPLVDTFTKKDNASNILQTAIALGEYGNVSHAKEIIATLMMQAGNPIVGTDTSGDYESKLGAGLGYTVRPSDAAINFYTQFADPLRSVYSWNRSLPQSKDMFISGDVAMYVGYASEIQEIRKKNPNLNFDIAPLLQARSAKTKITYGNMQGLAILKSSKSVAGAFTAISYLTNNLGIKSWAQLTQLPPVRRDLLAASTGDSVTSVLYSSALWSRGWLDPQRTKTATIFKNLVETITSGKAQTSEAVQRADQELNNLLGPFNAARATQ